jgi:hypothetical protein
MQHVAQPIAKYELLSSLTVSAVVAAFALFILIHLESVASYANSMPERTLSPIFVASTRSHVPSPNNTTSF